MTISIDRTNGCRNLALLVVWTFRADKNGDQANHYDRFWKLVRYYSCNAKFLDTVGVHVDVIEDSDASNKTTNLGCNRAKVFGMI